MSAFTVIAGGTLASVMSANLDNRPQGPAGAADKAAAEYLARYSIEGARNGVCFDCRYALSPIGGCECVQSRGPLARIAATLPPVARALLTDGVQR